MDWDAISAVGAITSTAAVVGTLVYLAKQVSESRRAISAQIYQARADAASRALASFPIVPKFISIRQTMSPAEALASLTDEERFSLQASVAELMIRMDNSYFQYRQGLMDNDQLDVIKNAIRNRRELRHAMNIDVETMLLSRSFKDLVKEIDSEPEQQHADE